jgi:hypothetical protein
VSHISRIQVRIVIAIGIRPPYMYKWAYGRSPHIALALKRVQLLSFASRRKVTVTFHSNSFLVHQFKVICNSDSSQPF